MAKSTESSPELPISMAEVYEAITDFFSEHIKSSFKADDFSISQLLTVTHEILSSFDNNKKLEDYSLYQNLSIKYCMRELIIN